MKFVPIAIDQAFWTLTCIIISINLSIVHLTTLNVSTCHLVHFSSLSLGASTLIEPQDAL
jgi:hypothetical protein